MGIRDPPRGAAFVASLLMDETGEIFTVEYRCPMKKNKQFLMGVRDPPTGEGGIFL